MVRSRGGLLLAAAVAVAVLAGCGKPVDAASDGGLSTVAPVPPPPPTGPTSVPPTGPCQVRFEVPEPVATTPAPPTATTAPPAGSAEPPAVTTSRALPPGDAPPNHVDNRSWRVRKALRPEVRSAAVAVAEAVRPGLGALCDAGNFDQAATRAVFAGAGRPEVWLTGLNSPLGATPPAGVVFVLTLAGEQGTGCVLGHLHPGQDGGPGQLLVSVDGTTGEGSCYEPPSH
ncbi:hypothetical protein [Saccharothrix algeriensis]|uniref:Lipoprotein n=1 Tax=Saccharothrix algeriensis TaxID=173560 RepID=A0ABS2SCY6_9PSEU|nr:hypothetical protein [Saccharothrix algeriensis]MBM7814128.1 hypothetical protein [Saccharothrix algeriensis]